VFAGVASSGEDSFGHEDFADAAGFLYNSIIGVVKDTLGGEFDLFYEFFIINGFISSFVGDVLADGGGGDAEFFRGLFLTESEVGDEAFCEFFSYQGQSIPYHVFTGNAFHQKVQLLFYTYN
jgi:hypothetical protein